MSVVLLVRHGQASFGTGDYDRLSALGEEQARRLGAVLAARGVAPGLVVTGSLRRQEVTAKLLVESAGWTADLSTDAGWNEFDHLGLVRAHSPVSDAPTDSRAFQVTLEAAMRRWSLHEPGVHGSFAAFQARTRAALRRLTDRLGPGATAVVATSAGVISLLTADLLDGGVEQWVRLNRVCINTAVTKLVLGRQGLSLVSFNDHSHLDATAVTYR